MNNVVRSRRSTIDESNPTGRIGYVLRRYGGLDVYVPRYPCNDAIGCLHRSGALIGTPQLNVTSPGNNGVETGTSDSTEIGFTSREFQQACLSQRNLPFGKFTALFGGRIVLGPGKGIFVISILFFIALFVHIILEKDLIEQFCGGRPSFILGCVFSGLIIISFLLLGITDPGVVPKNYSLQELLTETEEYRVRHPTERYFRYCNKCRTCRPPRTFHCSRCEICVRQQETHLWGAGTCVGERSRKYYFLFLFSQTLLGIYLLTINLTIAPNIQKGSENFAKDLVQIVACAVAGLILLFFPQGGLFMLMYRIYLIGVGRTAREEYRKYHCYNTEDCFVDEYPLCINFRNFFCKKSPLSVFRRRLNRIDPEVLPIEEMPTPWILEQTLGRRPPHFRNSQDLVIQEYVEQEDDEADILNGNRVNNLNESVETMRLREVANYARGKSTPSVPLFEHGLSPPMTRIRMPRKSKPSSILQQRINAFQKASKFPKATVSNHKRQKLPVSLSDGCIPRTCDGLQEMIQLSRATQLRRIIQMILLRDREGLVEMSGRVNIAALVGMNRFDPDNLQLLELNNGLPMIAPRRREPEAGGHRLGAGVLGIPQMVAAGLLPTARDLANSVETMVGGGRIRRMPPVGRQRYTAITVVAPPDTGPRRALNMDDDIMINRGIPQPAPRPPQNNPYVIIPPHQMPPQPSRFPIPFPGNLATNIFSMRQETRPIVPTPAAPATTTNIPLPGISSEEEEEREHVVEENRLNNNNIAI